MARGLRTLAAAALLAWGGAAAADDAPAPAPEVRLDEVVVTTTRTPRPLRDLPTAVTVVPREELARSAAQTSDDALRAVPSFGLFRRSSSVAADPSSQGVDLRGLGPSGVSRSLVLRDGIPQNDPFGGFVYWRSLPLTGLDRIEVAPGGASALYGNSALGGVTQLFSRRIVPRSLDVVGEGGGLESGRLAVWGSDRRGDGGAALEAELFSSRGFEVVAPASRGAVDRTTPSRHAVVSGRAEARTGDVTLTARGGGFWEDQNGGTRDTTAWVRRLEYAASARWAPAGRGALELTVFGHAGQFGQRRARVAPGRGAEALAAVQGVPTHDLGASALWSAAPRALAGTHALSVGVDARRITGTVHEQLFPPAPVAATAAVRRDAGGEQLAGGAFVQDVYDVSRALSITAALRYDRWVDLDASRREQLAGGGERAVSFARRAGGHFSPRVGASARAADALTLRAAAYGSFRAPTLGELYRPFQVGTVRTEANEDLGPETLRGGEAGADVVLPAGATARATAFWNRLDDPIVNVTTSATAPDRQRRNLGAARVRGLEAELAWRWARRFTAIGAYTLVDARVTSAPGQPSLVGKELPQDPRHRASASLAYEDRRLAASAQLRWLGAQFEDDLNTLPMGDAVVVDLFASWRLRAGVSLFAAVENLLDRTYLVGRAGVDTIGQPRFVHGGVRISAGG